VEAGSVSQFPDEYEGWKQISDVVGWDPKTCRRWAARRDDLRLPVFRVGSRVRMKRSDFERWWLDRERSYVGDVH
jgi:hypothetical protein